MKQLWLAAAASLCVAQTFEVASIRPHNGVVTMTGRRVDGPLINIEAMTVAELIADAFETRDYQLDGGPAWMKTERFDIAARVAGDAAPSVAEVRRMEQSLLAERFLLQFHRAAREMPVYALVETKSGAKLTANEGGNGGIAFRRPPQGQVTQGQVTDVTGSGAAIGLLVRSLSGIPGIDRPILDRTGLSGKYDFKLSLLYTFRADKSGQSATGPDGESVFTAIEEQLGLRLEPQRLPVDMLVVDRVERPSAN